MVQHRFTSMKQTFLTNFRKERESKGRCSGKSPEEIYKPKWILYDRLKFLKKACAQASSLSNLQSPINTSYSNTETYLNNDSNIETDSLNAMNIEYLESDAAEIDQLNMHNIQVSLLQSVYILLQFNVYVV